MDLYEKISLWEKQEGMQLFECLNLPDDANVLDLGCGFGHYSIAVSNALNGIGKVYAIDVNRVCLKHINDVIVKENINNIELQNGNKDCTLNFFEESLDMVMYYDILHGGDGSHKKRLLNEANRVLKKGGILSVLPFHLSNFRDDDGKKKKYTYAKLISEIEGYGFKECIDFELEGIHFEKCHTQYYMNKGGIEFESLEKAKILTFIKQ